MSLKTRTPTRTTPPSTGDQEGSPAQAPDPAPRIPEYGWKRLISAHHLMDAEEKVCYTLGTDGGLLVEHAGKRGQSYDLTIVDELGRRPYIRQAGLVPGGRYEVKSLWRRNPSSAFDRRFKAGQRGERIYGRRDAAIKAFALALENQIDAIVEHSLDPEHPAEPGTVRRFVEETHEVIDQAITRRHSKSFIERLERLARASMGVPTMLAWAHPVLHTMVQPQDILKGFKDIEGIFIVAGPMYTLVTRTEMPEFLAFDSASAEGPKLRLVGVIPSEQDSRKRKKGNK